MSQLLVAAKRPLILAGGGAIEAAAELTRLAEALGKVAGKPVNLKVVVDPSVIGGLVATIGDEVIDDTVRTRLDQVKARF